MGTGRQWRAPAWAWSGYLLIMALLLSLGSWQAKRGLAKQDLAEAESATLSPVLWQPGLQAQWVPAVHAELRGHYQQGQWLLLDNQTFERRPGYHLWGLFAAETETGTATVLVNRGWVPLHRERDAIPDYPFPSGTQTLEGLWRPLPKAGIALATSTACTKVDLPVIVQYPSIETLRCISGLDVADGVFLLSPEADDPLARRQWSLTAGVPATRHFGYSAQWFTFALVLSYFFVTLNFRKSTHE